MDKQEIIQMSRSGVFAIEYFKGDTICGSGSGFMVAGYLVTNHHVYSGAVDCRVVIVYQPHKESLERRCVNLTCEEFRGSLVSGSDENNLDYAILNIPSLNCAVEKVFNFDLNPDHPQMLGDEVIALGFPLYSNTLVAQFGRISSIAWFNDAKAIQIDCCINSSNSGGPLICAKTGDVIGIVTKKAYGFSNAMPDLKKWLDSSISNFSNSLDEYRLSSSKRYDKSIDVAAAFSIVTRQVQQIITEMERSANVGIAYALTIDELKSKIDQLK
nr:serine protease [Pseudomonas juntendi]